MNVSGHLLSTAQIESALIEHHALSEAAVVSFMYNYFILQPCNFCANISKKKSSSMGTYQRFLDLFVLHICQHLAN